MPDLMSRTGIGKPLVLEAAAVAEMLDRPALESLLSLRVLLLDLGVFVSATLPCSMLRVAFSALEGLTSAGLPNLLVWEF